MSYTISFFYREKGLFYNSYRTFLKKIIDSKIEDIIDSIYDF